MQYLGEGFDDDVYAVAVDDKNLYWRATANRILFMPKEGGEPEPFVVCPTCQVLPEPDDHGLVYFLDGAQLLQVDRDTRKEVRIDLPWSHGAAGSRQSRRDRRQSRVQSRESLEETALLFLRGCRLSAANSRRPRTLSEALHGAGGGLFVEEDYVYTAMRGCAAILRINRSTLEIEEMYVDGVDYPGRGHTTLARSGDGLVCGSPTDIYAFEEWGAPANHLSSEGDCAFDLVVVDGFAHWWQIPSSNDPDSIGTVPVSGGAVIWALCWPETHPRLHAALE